MATWKKYFNTYTPPRGDRSPISGRSSANPTSNSVTLKNFNSFLPEVYSGQSNRVDRYYQYEIMDQDPEVNAALDIIAEFCTEITPDNGTTFKFHYQEQPTDIEVKILKQSLVSWFRLNELDRRMFRLFRNTLKYGDQFLVRDPQNGKLYHAEARTVDKVIVNESEGKKPEQYVIRDLNVNLQSLNVTQIAPNSTSNTTYSTAPSVMGATAPRGSTYNFSSGGATGGRFSHSDGQLAVAAEHVVHLSLSEGLDTAWPFGLSILETVFKTFKQKELIEDAIIIYRVQRAPERRIFKIDTGNLPSHLAMQFVERVKNEIYQRRIPSQTGGGQNITDATYNPISTNEDFFFAVGTEGRGSSVETLPGGCLSMDTQVLLLDGRSLSIRDLAEEYRQGKTNWTYSTNPETGEVVPGVVSWAGVTHKSAQVLRLTLDNGKQIVCTPDHKFPILNKGLVRADELIVGESFIPCNVKNEVISKHTKRQYTQVYQNNTKQWQFVHRMVAKYTPISELIKTQIFNEVYAEKEKSVVHHADHNRFNNNPENLALMNFWDHQEYHSFHGFSAESQQLGTLAAREKLENLKKNDPEEYQNLLDFRQEQLRNWRESRTPEYWENHCNKISQAIKEYFDGLSAEERSLRAEISAQNALLATAKLQELLSTDEEFRQNYTRIHKEGFEKFRSMPHYQARNEKIAAANVQRYQNPEYKERVFKNQRIKYDKFLLDQIQSLVKGKTTHEVSATDVVDHVNHTEHLLNHFLELNKDTKCANWSNNKFTQSQLMQLVKQHGYESWRHFRSESDLYNHKLVSVEVLSDPIEVGTLTIDVEEKYHNYHNFALEAGVFTQNSNLGEIDDLRFFTNKLFRALRIPSSYLPTGPEDSQAVYNDGRTGTALIQELRFNKYCQRLQGLVSPSLDLDFKVYLKQRGINIDTSMFELRFSDPQNFSQFKTIDVDSNRLTNFQAAVGLPFIAKRWAMARYLGLSEQEIVDNETQWKKENGKAVSAASGSDLRSVGVTPGGIGADMEAFGPEPDLGAEAGDLGATEAGDLGAEEGAAAPPGAAPPGPVAAA